MERETLGVGREFKPYTGHRGYQVDSQLLDSVNVLEGGRSGSCEASEAFEVGK